MIEKERRYTIKEVADETGYSRPALYNLVRDGILEAESDPTLRGNPYLVDAAGLEKFREYMRSTPRYGPPRGPKGSQEKEPCRFPGDVGAEPCPRKAKVRGLCRGHYSLARHSARWEHLLPEECRAARCLVPRCENPQYYDGICNIHQEQINRGTAPVVEIPPLENPTAEAVRLRRRLMGHTLESLAEVMGVSGSRVGHIELTLDRFFSTGKGLGPEVISAYLKAIKVDPEEIVPLGSRPAPKTKRSEDDVLPHRSLFTAEDPIEDSPDEVEEPTPPAPPRGEKVLGLRFGN